jgi:hypothetical protein
MILKKLGTAFASLMLATVIMLNGSTAQAAAQLWTGAGDGANWSDASNWNLGAVSNGDTLTFDNTDLTADGATVNDLPNASIGRVTFTGSQMDYQMATTGNPFVLSNGIESHNTGIFVVDNDIHSNGKLIMNSYSDTLLAFAREIYAVNNLGLRSYNDSEIQIYSIIRGVGQATVYVSGDSNSSYGTYVAPTGYIRPNTVVNNHGYLYGSGRVLGLNVTSTGHIYASTCLTTGNLNIDGTMYTRFGMGGACKGYSQIVTKGTVNVSGGTLNTTGSLSYAPAKGTEYILINNDGTDRVIGTFRGKAEGAKFKIGSYTFRISYRGGSGNDIVLTRL